MGFFGKAPEPPTDIESVAVSSGPDQQLLILHQHEEEIRKRGFLYSLNPYRKKDIQLPDLNEEEVRVHQKLRQIQYIMDESLCVPWNKDAKMGIDPIIGFIPVVGDFVSAFTSAFFVFKASSVLSRYTITRMLVNVCIDAVLGLIPIIGDFFDFGFKANTRNMVIFEDQMMHGAKARGDVDRKWVLTAVLLFFLANLIGTLITVAFTIWLIYFLWNL